MKKLLLTGVTAAFLGFSAMAQQQDSVQNPSNEFRPSDEQQQNPANTDTTSNFNYQNQQQQDQDLQQQPGNEFNQDANDFRDSVNQNDMERQGNEFQQNPQELNEPGLQQNDDNMNAQPEGQQTDSTLNEMNNQFESSVEDSQGNTAAPDIEIIKDKEGPDNQVVYKYQGDLYYIDRDTKELVKADASELQDAEHDVIVDQGSGEESDTDRASNR